MILFGNNSIKSKSIRIMTLFVASFMLFGISKSARAEGGINANESRVIGVASGTFEYDGEMYRAAGGYISQLQAYLSKDGVDLTAAQADAAISKIYSNVATGVKEGYIVKVSSDSDAESKDNGKDKNEVNDEGKKEEEATSTPKPTEAPTPVPQLVEQSNGTLDVYNSDGEAVASLDGILKNTGYSIYNTLIMLGVIGMIFVLIMVFCFVQILKNKSIARERTNES